MHSLVKKQELKNATAEKALAEEATQRAKEEGAVAQQEKEVLLGTIVQGYLKKGYNRATEEMMAREFFRYES